MKVIGFAGQYYTLWEVSEPYRVYINQHSFYMKTDYVYYKNLSMDLEKAKEKMGDSQYSIDLNLKGTGSWSFEAKYDIRFDRSKVNDAVVPYDIPTLKNYAGCDIRNMGLDEMNKDHEIKKLWCLYLKKDIWNNKIDGHSFKNLNPHWVRPVVYARRQLINLGILERFEGQYVTENYKKILINKKIQKKLEKGFLFENKKRIILEVKKLHSFSFESFYGLTFVCLYQTKCGKLIKYMGSNPPDISDQNFTKIKGTVKHSEYQGEKETKLQRITVL